MSDQERETGIIISHPNRECDPDYSKEFNIVGKESLRRKDGYEKASGKAVYSMDFVFPGTLYARILRCPYANAVIKSMDDSKAAAIPGVRYILRYDDPNPYVKALVVPAHGYFEGEPMGAIIVADTDEIAQEALRQLEVEWEVLPFVLECDDALADDAPLVYNPRGFYAHQTQARIV
jgi:CO/xanthine dehydrogenase Mo-binding subunit